MKFQTIYPQYLDSSLTPGHGRRVTAKQGVPKPTLEEIFIALRQMGFAEVFADPTKSLPCAQSQPTSLPPPRGCIKVSIKELAEDAKNDGERERKSVNANYTNKNQVMKEICARIAAIPDRKVVEMTPAQIQSKQMAEEAAVQLAKSAKSKGMNLGGLLGGGAGGGPKQKVKVIRR